MLYDNEPPGMNFSVAFLQSQGGVLAQTTKRAALGRARRHLSIYASLGIICTLPVAEKINFENRLRTVLIEGLFFVLNFHNVLRAIFLHFLVFLFFS